MTQVRKKTEGQFWYPIHPILSHPIPYLNTCKTSHSTCKTSLGSTCRLKRPVAAGVNYTPTPNFDQKPCCHLCF